MKSVEGKRTASVQTPAPSTEQCQTGVSCALGSAPQVQVTELCVLFRSAGKD